MAAEAEAAREARAKVGIEWRKYHRVLVRRLMYGEDGPGELPGDNLEEVVLDRHKFFFFFNLE